MGCSAVFVPQHRPGCGELDPRMLVLVSLLCQQALAQLRANMKFKALQLCAGASFHCQELSCEEQAARAGGDLPRRTGCSG